MYKIRTEITKGEALRYISHLDYAAVMERSIRRAKLPVAYSEGFNPHMKIAFGSALAVGVTSAAEYMDIELKAPIAIDEFCQRLRVSLPCGVELLAAREVVGKQPALMAIVDLARYLVTVPFAGDIALIQQAVADYNAAAMVVYIRHTPKGKKEIELKQYMQEPIQVKYQAGGLCFSLAIKIMPTGSVKPGEVLRALREQFALPVDEQTLLIHRQGLYTQGKKTIEV